ncbi:MAG: hypothetical protein HY742_05040 [Deltaproteobacteria bacterium]|nr:hypothetical protein [Deltaproteobacteria bacterium]
MIHHPLIPVLSLLYPIISASPAFAAVNTGENPSLSHTAYARINPVVIPT